MLQDVQTPHKSKVLALFFPPHVSRPKKDLSESPTRWWFQTFFIFSPTWGDDPI